MAENKENKKPKMVNENPEIKENPEVVETPEANKVKEGLKIVAKKEKLAKKIFERSRYNVLYITSDMLAFANKTDADDHALTLENKEVMQINRNKL